jgi:hypothetical protein
MLKGRNGVVSLELMSCWSACATESRNKAMPELQGRGILEGFRAPRSNPLTVNPDGTVRLTTTATVLRSSQTFAWDAVKRKLDEDIGKLVGKGGDRPQIEYRPV